MKPYPGCSRPMRARSLRTTPLPHSTWATHLYGKEMYGQAMRCFQEGPNLASLHPRLRQALKSLRRHSQLVLILSFQFSVEPILRKASVICMAGLQTGPLGFSFQRGFTNELKVPTLRVFCEGGLLRSNATEFLSFLLGFSVVHVKDRAPSLHAALFFSPPLHHAIVNPQPSSPIQSPSTPTKTAPAGAALRRNDAAAPRRCVPKQTPQYHAAKNANPMYSVCPRGQPRNVIVIARLLDQLSDRDHHQGGVRRDARVRTRRIHTNFSAVLQPHRMDTRLGLDYGSLYIRKGWNRDFDPHESCG